MSALGRNSGDIIQTDRAAEATLWLAKRASQVEKEGKGRETRKIDAS